LDTVSRIVPKDKIDFVIAIVGGGITGLAAAYELTIRKVPFQLFEASPRLGGIIRTEQVDGLTIEAGPDSILAQKPAAVELCEALGLGPRLITSTPPRTAFVLNNGRLSPLPSPSVLGIPTTWRGLVHYDLLSPGARARLALERIVPRGRVEDESVGAFFRRRFGAETVHTIAEPLLGGIHAGDINALSMRSLFPRFVEAEVRVTSLRDGESGRTIAGCAFLDINAAQLARVRRLIEAAESPPERPAAVDIGPLREAVGEVDNPGWRSIFRRS